MSFRRRKLRVFESLIFINYFFLSCFQSMLFLTIFMQIHFFFVRINVVFFLIIMKCVYYRKAYLRIIQLVLTEKKNSFILFCTYFCSISNNIYIYIFKITFCKVLDASNYYSFWSPIFLINKSPFQFNFFFVLQRIFVCYLKCSFKCIQYYNIYLNMIPNVWFSIYKKYL